MLDASSAAKSADLWSEKPYLKHHLINAGTLVARTIPRRRRRLSVRFYQFVSTSSDLAFYFSCAAKTQIGQPMSP